MVRAKEGASYADILRRMKAAPNLRELSSNVVKITRSAKGDLLLQLSRSADQKTHQFLSSMSENLKEMAEVRMLTHEPVLELKDLDELTTEEDICEAFKYQLEGAQDAKVVVKSLRKAYGGTQTAVITLPTNQKGHNDEQHPNRLGHQPHPGEKDDHQVLQMLAVRTSCGEMQWAG